MLDKFLEIGLILIAVSCVAVADVLIKKAAVTVNSFWVAVRNPLMPLATALYVA